MGLMAAGRGGEWGGVEGLGAGLLRAAGGGEGSWAGRRLGLVSGFRFGVGFGVGEGGGAAGAGDWWRGGVVDGGAGAWGRVEGRGGGGGGAEEGGAHVWVVPGEEDGVFVVDRDPSVGGLVLVREFVGGEGEDGEGGGGRWRGGEEAGAA